LITRRAARWGAVACGAVLLVGLRLAPELTGVPLRVLSLAWLLALGGILWLALHVLRPLIGPIAAALIVAAGAAAPILLTAMPTSPEWSLRLPCPRNWAWIPTWLLRPSPLASLRFDVGDARVKVCYGRPAARGRKMIGGPPVPFGHLWRSGANEPTIVIATAPIEIAGVLVPAGRTALYTVPGPETWEVVLNASTSQWGLESEYSNAVRRSERGRAIVRAETAPQYQERLTFTFEPLPGQGASGLLRLEWERVRVTLPVERRP
jgi:hypothetical protein